MARARDFEGALIDCLPALRRYAMVLTRNAADRDDLVQETLAAALASVRGFDRARPLLPWLLRIQHNLFVTSWRRRRAAPPEIPASVDDHVTLRAEVREVLRALTTLAEEQRHAIALIALEELSYAEAAEVLGIPRGTLMSRLARGRQALREALNRPAAALRLVNGDKA
ncbi:MAG: sigma-70 family RNA polymerase sigma factor [Azospirillaceae bacterium]